MEKNSGESENADQVRRLMALKNLGRNTPTPTAK
jgi:hypothetical protein